MHAKTLLLIIKLAKVLLEGTDLPVKLRETTEFSITITMMSKSCHINTVIHI